LPLQKQAYALAPGLLDPVENVRSAAASAIDRSFNPTLRTGLANMLSIHVKEAPDIIQAVIDAQCGRVFMGLVDDPAFGDAAFRYLGNSAHPDVREYFLRVIEERGRVDLIDRLAVRPKPPEEQRVRVMAVDDSKMILKIMRGMLHKLGCEALLYEFPSVALQELQAQKPDLLFTDLNMPDITGIDLTRQVRRSFGPDVLPIVMVTTQQEETDHQTAYQAGVDYILPKPFTEEQLDQVIRRFARRTQKAAA
jgi:CheY-like chemotaxis protein